MKQQYRYSFAVIFILMMVCSSLSQTTTMTRILEAPFDFDHNEIMLQVKINGQGPYTMLLDTDTDPSTINLETAKALGLKLKPLAGHGSGGGTEKATLYQTSLPMIDAGGITAKSIDAIALDLSKFAEKLGKPVAGVLGNSFLSGRIVQINYPKHMVRFYDISPLSASGPQANTDHRLTLPFKYDEDEGSLMIDDVYVNGKKVRAAVDTGSDGAFALTPAATRDLGLEEQAAKGEAEVSVGYNGAAANRRGKVDKIMIGTIPVDSPAVVFFGKGTGRDHKPWGLNIGNAFLKDYVVTIDYKRKLIVFELPGSNSQ